MALQQIDLQVFFLILFRIIGMMIRTPVLSSQHIPALGRMAISIWVAGLLWFVAPSAPPSLTGVIFILALANEFIIGLLMGFVAEAIFLAVQMAGELMDLQMGLSIASTFDPIFGAQVSVIGRFASMFALVLFLVAGGHHMMLEAIHKSLTILPIGVPINLFSQNLVYFLAQTVQKLVLLSVQLAAPIMLLLFLTDFAFGIVSRVAPQVNVFMLSFQSKPSIGLIGIFFALPLLIRHTVQLVPQIANQLVALMGIVK